MSDFVLDASVLAASYLPATAEQRSYAENIIDLMRNGAVPAVPPLIDIEVGAVLIEARRKRVLTQVGLSGALKELECYFFEIHHVPYSVPEIVRIAQAYMLTGYDAIYFDLAKRLGLPLASLDKGHRTACKSYGVQLLSF